MEERIKNLELQMITLQALCLSQQETIESLTNCINTVSGMLERETKFDANIFLYCKKLRSEINSIKKDMSV